MSSLLMAFGKVGIVLLISKMMTPLLKPDMIYQKDNYKL